MYGIPEAGRLANELLTERLKTFGYIERVHNPAYWKHMWKPIKWTLIVNDLGVQYTDKQYITELLKIMSKWYVCKIDWEG